jgi:hypothetical protein
MCLLYAMTLRPRCDGRHRDSFCTLLFDLRLLRVHVPALPRRTRPVVLNQQTLAGMPGRALPCNKRL